jgi:hypothetical protein
MVAGRQQVSPSRFDVDDIEMLPTVGQVAGAVLLELVAAGDDRRRVLRLGCAFRPLRVPGDDSQLRPSATRHNPHAVGEFGDLACLAARPASAKPGLGVFAASIGKECQPATVCAP